MKRTSATTHRRSPAGSAARCTPMRSAAGSRLPRALPCGQRPPAARRQLGDRRRSNRRAAPRQPRRLRPPDPTGAATKPGPRLRTGQPTDHWDADPGPRRAIRPTRRLTQESSFDSGWRGWRASSQNQNDKRTGALRGGLDVDPRRSSVLLCWGGGRWKGTRTGAHRGPASWTRSPGQMSSRKRSTRPISKVIASVTTPSRAISRSSEMDLTSSHFA
jgi:hypothetical protein